MISEDLGIKLKNVKLNDLGKAKKVLIEKENTTIVEGGGKKHDIVGAEIRSVRRSRKNYVGPTTARSCRKRWRSGGRRRGDRVAARPRSR